MTVAISPIATVAAITVPVAIAEAALVAAERPIVTTTLEGRLLPPLGLAGLRLGMCERRRLEAVVEHILALLVAELVAVAEIGRPTHALAVAVGEIARLTQLLAVGHDDAVVVLGVLKIILCQHRVAGGLRVTGERKILLGNMRRRAPDLHVRPVGLEAAR
jgi:hypothetical protein